MSKLKIIRASAGSGKTYSLTKEVLLTLITEDLTYFKSLLAVTFTNKATAEMKERILKELHLLASNQASDHLEALVAATGKNEKGVRTKANAILRHILHGYSWFRIETIDTFFQGIIRSFVRELGIAGNYNIELDQDKILGEAIDALLEDVGNNKEVLKWLLEHIDTKISEGKSWDVTGELINLGRTLFSESLITRLPDLQNLMSEADFLKTYRKTLTDIRDSFESKITHAASKALANALSNGIEIGDYYQSTKGPVAFLQKLVNKRFDPPNSYTLKAISENKWAAGKSSRKEEVMNIGTNTLAPALQEILAIFEAEIKDYNTAQIILKNLHIMGMLVRLNNELTKIRRDKSIFLISDAAPFIQKIINENDTPFIYEKAGNHFNHLLIDEFQDTSNMQWANFKPLISNSLSKDKSCLIVGDVKQSIYRWRNSNWEILENQVTQDFNNSSLQQESLDTNWRSDKTIVDFNNVFFQQAVQQLDAVLSNANIDISLPSTIYSDVSQKPSPKQKNDRGFVAVKIYNKAEVKEDEEYFSNELIDRINDALNSGYNPGDIAILIRNKKEGTTLANLLVEANKQQRFLRNIGVISNESLFLNSSPIVSLLLSAMRYVHTPDSELLAAGLLANYMHANNSEEHPEINFPKGKFDSSVLKAMLGDEIVDSCLELKQESLYRIAEKLSLLFNLFSTENNLVYLHSFLDIVFDYSTKEQSDLGRFLSYWDEEGAKKTISAAETDESVRILTIHKSKGLEFPIVFLPFGNWSILPKANEKMWLEPNEEPYKQLPFVPVNYTAQLENSIFKNNYERENYLTLIDNINLLYVAFTRAKSALVTFLVESTDKMNATNRLIIDTLNTLTRTNEKQIDISFNDNDNRYICGTFPEKESSNERKNGIHMQVDTPTGQIPEVRISRYSDDFLSESIDEKDSATIGRIYHSIMEDCVTINDLSPSIQRKIQEGILSDHDEQKVLQTLQKALQHPDAATWFDGGYKILTEADIIVPGGGVKRPDRIMLKDNTAIVVDYKFGQEDDKNKHIRQVQQYVKLVKNSGIANVVGYVWYVLEKDIIAVQ